MKKLHIAVVLALGLVIPFTAIAATTDAEVTIRVMEMHEKSTASVMNRIELPDAADDKVIEEENYRKRLIEHKGDGEGTGEGVAEMDRDRIYDLEQIQNQDQEEMEQEQAQDQIRDSVPGPEDKPETGNGAGAGSK
jgi:hypothetical protein